MIGVNCCRYSLWIDGKVDLQWLQDVRRMQLQCTYTNIPCSVPRLYCVMRKCLPHF